MAGDLHGKLEAASLPLTLAHFSAAVIPAACVLFCQVNGDSGRGLELGIGNSRLLSVGCLVLITNEAMGSEFFLSGGNAAGRAGVALELRM